MPSASDLSSERVTEAFTLRLIEAHIVVLVVRLRRDKESRGMDPAMATQEEHMRAVAQDARRLWAEICRRRGLVEALIGANENLERLGAALNALDGLWRDFLDNGGSAFVEEDVVDGLRGFAKWIFRAHSAQTASE